MNRFDANDLRNLITEVVSSYQEQKLKWLLESPETLREGVFDPQILKCIFMAAANLIQPMLCLASTQIKSSD